MILGKKIGMTQIFENEKLDYCAWGYEIPMEEAEEVVKKIKEFLKKRNNNELE